MATGKEIKEFLSGIALTFLFHLLVLTIGGTIFGLIGVLSSIGAGRYMSEMLGMAALYFIFGIGISQLLYIIPLTIWLRKKGRTLLANGVIVGAIITALLNGGCYVMIFSGNFRIAG